MLVELFLICWSYSCYLHLRQWAIGLYCIWLGGAVWSYFYFGNSETTYMKGTYTKIGGFAQVAFHIMCMVFTIKAACFFHKSGGIHGADDTKLKPGDEGYEESQAIDD